MGTIDETGNLHVTGRLSAGTFDLPAGSITNAACSASMALARTKLAQDAAQEFVVPWSAHRVFDAYGTNLPTTAASDDLGLIAGTFGSASPQIQTSDAKATTVTQKSRFEFAIPECYEAGETITLRARAYMVTTVSDGTATIDFSAYESDKAGGIGSDLCTTAATTINSLTPANIDFTIDPSALDVGDVLDCQMTIAITDTATGTAVIGAVGWLGFLLDIRG